MDKELLFALDIGTRSVVGIVGEHSGEKIRLLAVERQEHNTRAMLDGQIHDVPQVAAVLANVKNKLETVCGPLNKVSIAAAGRALCTITASADIEASPSDLITDYDQRRLELSAIQAAQQKLATSSDIKDPTGYYCVGYSVVQYLLDNNKIKSLVGQRGKKASTEVIATFLPRQVIDSLQSAVNTVGLTIATLTLEPIAAINVLIPPSMRHLNIALVDVGAGTSDVAITKDGSVVGYGMVPLAGDEITEAISAHLLLDFNVAETVKRQLTNPKMKKISYTDILGVNNKVTPKEVITVISPNVGQLAQAIANEILTLNATPPQAVLLVGGGSLTPMLPEAVAQSLDIPASRVAIRRPDTVEGLVDIPDSLRTPDAVTPLGILKLSTGNALNFVNVLLNNGQLSLFNIGRLTIGDALLAAGISIRSLHGKPGLGMTITVNGKTSFFPGTLGTPGQITLNGQPADFSDLVQEGDAINVVRGKDGMAPALTVEKAITVPSSLIVSINNKEYHVPPVITVNGQSAGAGSKLKDRDQVTCSIPTSLEEVLSSLELAPHFIAFNYTINGEDRSFTRYSAYRINGLSCSVSKDIRTGDDITIIQPQPPTVAELAGVNPDSELVVTVSFNGQPCKIPIRRFTVLINGTQASLTAQPANGSIITTSCCEIAQAIVSDVLLAANFNPMELPPGSNIQVHLNGRPTEYTATVRNGDSVEVVVTPPIGEQKQKLL